MKEDFDIRQEQGRKGEKDFENALRPLRFGDFSGQQKVVENLEVFVEAAKYRGEPLDHTLLHGPPGLGKTTLSNIIANELGVGFKITSGPVLDKPGDLAGILTSLEPREVLFIDEIHRLSPVVEEYLYSAMEDYRIDIMIDKGPSARSIQIDLNPFTLVGATTRSGLLTAPLRARFGINLHLEYYGPEMLQKIIKRSAMILKVPIDDDAAIEIARRSRGTPRIANALLRRVRDFAQVKGNGRIDRDIARLSLSALNIDQYGLDEIDNKILLTIITDVSPDIDRGFSFGAWLWVVPLLMVVWCVMVQWVLPIHHAVGHLEIFWSRVPIFFIGINFGELVRTRRQLPGESVWLLLLTFLMTFGTCLYLEQVRHGHFPLFVERMLYIPFTVCTVLVMNRIFRRMPQWVNSAFRFVGALSLEAYLIHIHFVLVYVQPYHMGYWPTFLITVAITLPIAWLLQRAIGFVSARL